MMRRGIAINTLGRIILGLLVVLVIAVFLWAFRDRLQDLVIWFQDVVRFGL